MGCISNLSAIAPDHRRAFTWPRPSVLLPFHAFEHIATIPVKACNPEQVSHGVYIMNTYAIIQARFAYWQNNYEVATGLISQAQHKGRLPRITNCHAIRDALACSPVWSILFHSVWALNSANRSSVILGWYGYEKYGQIRLLFLWLLMVIYKPDRSYLYAAWAVCSFAYFKRPVVTAFRFGVTCHNWLGGFFNSKFSRVTVWHRLLLSCSG